MTKSTHGVFQDEFGWHYRIKHGAGSYMVSKRANGSWTQSQAQRAYGRHKERIKWEVIWTKVINNMPVRVSEKDEKHWWEIAKGKTPLPDFVKARANGEMKIDNGLVYELRTKHIVTQYGQISLAARMLGYMYKDKKTGTLKVNSQGFYNVRSWGYKPRDPAKLELALALAGPNGNAMAWAFLRQHGRDHLYSLL